MALHTAAPNIQILTRKLGLQGELALLDRAWEREAGTLGDQAVVAALDNQVVVIEVRSSAAMQDLSLRRRELVRRLNAHFPTPWIRDLSVRLARYGNGH
jgi:hypothetical protein